MNRVPPLRNVHHEMFIKGILKGMSQAQAYLFAGYDPTSKKERTITKAGQLFGRPEVQKRLEYLRYASAKSAAVSKTKVLRELDAIAHSDIRKAVKWGESVAVKDAETGEYVSIQNTLAIRSSDDIDDATAAAISEVSIDKTGNLKIKFHDKRAALHDLGTHLGMFVKRIGGPDGGPLQIDATIRPTMTPREAADVYAQSLNATAIEHVDESDDEEAADAEGGDSSATEDINEE